MITLKKDNQTLFSSDGWRVVDIDVGDSEVENHISNASGLPGGNFYGVEYGTRTIRLTFDRYISSLDEYKSKRRELYRVFNQGECQLFLEDDRYINVTKQEKLDIIRIGHTKMRCTVSLISTRLPYFESVDYDIQTFSDSADITYNNKSDVDLDNRYTDTVMTLKLNSTADFYQISTNGTSWRYKKPLSSGDVLTLRGATTFKDNEDVLEDTTLNILTLKPGNNVLEMLGSMQYELTIRSKIYYY